MNYYHSVIQSVKQLPEDVRRFLMRAAVLFAAWKMLYLFILIPAEMPDAWLVKKLGEGTAYGLNAVYNTSAFTAIATARTKLYGNDKAKVTYSHVKRGNKKLIGIYQACNGLELMILYAGFILAFSGRLQIKLLFITGGIAALYLMNILRLVMLGYISIEHPLHFQFAHKYLFNLIVYAVTFFLWMGYVAVSFKKVKTQTI